MSESQAPATEPASASTAAARKPSPLARLAVWLVAAACFFFLYRRIDAAAARQGSDAVSYLAEVFGRVDWLRWLALMIPYSALFFLIDSLVVWRVVNWFNARVRYRDILPVRASTYILSILNEQVGKGAMAVYLNRREGVPGWQLGSSMLFIMFCEFYYLLFWATVGALWRWSAIPEGFRLVPLIAVGALAFFLLHWLYFRGTLLPGSEIRERHLLHAFRQASPWQYVVILVLRSPALLAAVVVYTLALGLFGVEVGFLQVLSMLPVIFFTAAFPIPLRAVPITMWALFFSESPGEAFAFGLVMHNFFIFFNAAIGLLFLRRANREIFA